MKKKTKDGAKRKYGRTNLDRLKELDKRFSQEEEKEGRRQFGDTPFWTPEVGENRIRILPPWSPDADLWCQESHVHYIAGKGISEVLGEEATEDYEGPISVICIAKALGKKCPGCERQRDLRQTRGFKDKKLAKAIAPRLRVYANIIDLNDTESGVQVWGFGIQLWRQLTRLDSRTDEEGGVEGMLTDPAAGYNVMLKRIGAGKKTKYITSVSRKATRIADPSWLKKLHDLAALAVPPSYEDAQQIVMESPAGIGLSDDGPTGRDDEESVADEAEDEIPF